MDMGFFSSSPMHPEIVPPLTPTPHRNTSDPDLTFVDGTPDYIQTPSAACRVAAVFPRAKLIAVLRNPVDVSHLTQELHVGVTPRPVVTRGDYPCPGVTHEVYPLSDRCYT